MARQYLVLVNNHQHLFRSPNHFLIVMDLENLSLSLEARFLDCALKLKTISDRKLSKDLGY